MISRTGCNCSLTKIAKPLRLSHLQLRLVAFRGREKQMGLGHRLLGIVFEFLPSYLLLWDVQDPQNPLFNGVVGVSAYMIHKTTTGAAEWGKWTEKELTEVWIWGVELGSIHLRFAEGFECSGLLSYPEFCSTKGARFTGPSFLYRHQMPFVLVALGYFKVN